MTHRLPGVTALPFLLVLTGPLSNHPRAQSSTAPVIQPAAAKLPAPAEDKLITEADCTAGKIGAIPVSAIGEPVASVTVSTAVWAPAAAAGSQGTEAAQCVVDGSMAPVDKAANARPINFRVVLPARWNRRAVQRGGGGMNGVIPQLTDADLGPGYVRYGSDSGHQSSSGGRRGGPGGDGRGAGAPASDNAWATNDEAIKNLAYMQLKKTHDAAFFIVERIYGERPRFSYFVGTSQGGREALTVVQRYPADYDGVVSIVPIVNFTTLMLSPELIRIHEKPLSNWVPPAKAAAVRAEFMRQCDGLDGLVDGVINNYMSCRAIFDVTRGTRGRPWAAKRCPNNIDANSADTTVAACLTDGQISTLEMIYSPYRFPAPLAHGVRQFGMWLPTTEPSGSGLLVGARFQGQEGAAADAARHSHLGVLGVTGWMQRDLSANPLDFTEAEYAERRRQLSEWADATNPDLSAFYARGGKLISAIGAQDTLASPGAQLDYYQSVLDKMGRQKVDAFARFYVLPQGNHGMTATAATVDGAGKEIPATRLPTTWNRFALLVDWVERNTPPGKSVTMTGGDQTMVLCSYPEYPKYKGGSALQASSYSCVER